MSVLLGGLIQLQRAHPEGGAGGLGGLGKMAATGLQVRCGAGAERVRWGAVGSGAVRCA